MRNLLKKRRFYIFILCLSIFILLLILVVKNGVLNIDNISYNFIKNNLIKDSITPYIKFFTNLGGSVVLIVLSIIIAVFLNNKKISLAIILNLGIVSILNLLVKIVVQRERPIINQLTSVSGYSFPSGHSAVSMAYYGFLIYLIYLYFDNKKYKWPLIIFLALIILFIGLSRIYLGVHYLSDVLAGFLFSLCYLFIFIYILNNFVSKKKNSTKS